MHPAPRRIRTIDVLGVANMLGVTRRYATDVITKEPDFPQPVIDLSQRIRRWNEEDVVRWIATQTARRSGTRRTL